MKSRQTVLSSLVIMSFQLLAGCGGGSGGSGATVPSVPAPVSPLPGPIAAKGMLHGSGRSIVDADGNKVVLKGFNLGGWFVMEDYMSPMDSGGIVDTYGVMTTLNARFGEAAQRALMKTYHQSWIQSADLDNIAKAGFNVVRVPVWWGQFFSLQDTTVAGWRSDAFDELDSLVAQAAARGIYVIIDMHGVIGGQNIQNTTGRAGQNAYWTNTEFQSETAWMWLQIAAHYKGNAAIAGYDVMNEPMGAPSKEAVWAAYASLYAAIRSADPDHMLFMEGTFYNWNWDMLPAPSLYGWTNVVYELHEYQGQSASAAQIMSGADAQAVDFAKHASWNVPGYIGEFNAFQGGASTWAHNISAFNGAGLSWSSWAYKAVNGVAPNYWGWYDPTSWPDRPNVSSDTQSEISRKWGLWTTSTAFAKNTSLQIQPAY